MCSACPTYLCTKCEGGGKGYFIILTVSFPHLIFSRIYMCEWLEGFFSSLIRYVFSIFFLLATESRHCISSFASTLRKKLAAIRVISLFPERLLLTILHIFTFWHRKRRIRTCVVHFVDDSLKVFAFDTHALKFELVYFLKFIIDLVLGVEGDYIFV